MKKVILSNFSILFLACLFVIPMDVFSQAKSFNMSGTSSDTYNADAFYSLLEKKKKEYKKRSPMSPKWTTMHPFDRRVFIENNGQFDGYLIDPNFNIEYGVREGKTVAYFSKTGIVYRHEVFPTMTEEEKEKLEGLVGTGKKRFEKLLMKKSSTVTFLGMEWLGANADVVIESESKVSDYFMYSTIKAYAYEKITYKNLYPNIDVAYTMRPFEEGGMKYVVILNPGADPSQIKMKYANDVKVKLNETGDLVFKTGKIEIKDLAPETFYSNGKGIASSFKLKGNEVSFTIGDYDNTKTVLIDPTVLFPAAKAIAQVDADFATGQPFTAAYAGGTASGKAYDVDFDFAGNVYVYGGLPPFSVLKFDAAGNQVWSFDVGDFYGAPGTAGIFGTAYGDFVVDPISQSIYLCEGFALFAGCRVGKIGPAGDSLGIYAGANDFNEMWRMGYNACTGQAIIAGASSASAASNLHMALVDTALTQNDAVDVLGNTNDMSTLAIDDFGSCFSACSQINAGGDPNTTNEMVKMSVPAFTVDWKEPSQHGNIEFNQNSYVEGASGGYNGLAVSDNFLYSYDGHILRQWDKASGVVLNSIILVPGNADFQYGGIDVDSDDNIYIGFNNTVDIYDVNLALISSTPAPNTITDIKLSADEQVYVCGYDFVTAFPALPISSNFNASVTTGCGSDTEAFPVNGVEPYFYSWAPTGEITKAATLAPGTYTVTVTESSCDRLVTTQTITVTSGGSSVAITLTPPATICDGEPTTLTAGGTDTYTWLPVDGLSAVTGASVVATPTVTTTYTVTGSTGGCSGTGEVTITVNATPVVDVNSQDVCTGTAAILIATGGTAYSWLPATDLDATTGATVNATPSTPTTYTVTGTAANGCTDTAHAVVTLSALPPVDAGVDITICSDETGNLGAPAVAPHTYLWAPTTDLSDPTSANPTVTTSNNTGSNIVTTYTVTTNPGGCEATEEVIVTVEPLEDTTFNYALATFCPPGTESPTLGTAGGTFAVNPGTGLSINGVGDVDLTASTAGSYDITYTTLTACPNSTTFNLTVTTNPDATFSYAGPYCQDAANPLPTFPVGSSAGLFSSTAGLVFANSSTGEVDIAASTAGTYTVNNDIAAGGGCPADTKSNTITIDAVPFTIVDNQTVCGGACATLTAGGADTYLWSDGSTQSTLTVCPTVQTSYTVTGTTSGCPSDTVGTIATSPTPVVIVSSATICVGDTTSSQGAFGANPDKMVIASGADTYTWSDGSINDTLFVNPIVDQTYTVTGTALGCSASDVAQVTVNPLPNIILTPTTVCEGLEATVVANGGGSYIYLHDTTFTNPHVFTPTATMQDTVFASTAVCPDVTNINSFFTCFIGGCTTFAEATVTVTQLPVMSITSDKSAICAGESATLTASGGNTVVWSPGGEITPVINVSPTSPTIYTVADNTPGCSASATITIGVNTPPDIAVMDMLGCEGASVILTATGTATDWTWSSGGTGSSTETITQGVGVTTYTVTGNPGVCDSSTTATVTITAAPILTVTNDSICEGATGTMTASGATAYTWSHNASGSSVTASPSTTGSIPYTVTGTAAGCSSTAIALIQVYPAPTAAFIYSPDRAGVLEPIITFTDKSSSDVTSWNWDFGDNDSVATSSANPIHTYPNIEETYTVVLGVSNPGSCTDTVSHTVIIGPEFTFFIPNAFSPNGDKINDDFGASGGGIMDFEFELRIFDRWGQEMFKTTDLNGRWNGDYLGAECPVDTYVWKVFLKDVYKKEHSYIGTVTIVK